MSSHNFRSIIVKIWWINELVLTPACASAHFWARGTSFNSWRSWVHGTVIWAPHSLIVSSLAIFWYNYHFAATFKSWSKLTKRRSDLANFGLKMVEKNRLFLGFSAITSSRLEIAPCKGARLWNLRTKRIFWHPPTLKILCVGGARDPTKTPFFTHFEGVTPIT